MKTSVLSVCIQIPLRHTDWLDLEHMPWLASSSLGNELLILTMMLTLASHFCSVIGLIRCVYLCPLISRLQEIQVFHNWRLVNFNLSYSWPSAGELMIFSLEKKNHRRKLLPTSKKNQKTKLSMATHMYKIPAFWGTEIRGVWVQDSLGYKVINNQVFQI